MTVLAYEIHENLATHHDAMEKLKDFAVARGWTLLDWRKANSAWAWTGSQYDFVAGSESFLMIQSSGYGSQVLHYRIWGEATGTDPNHENIEVGCPIPTQTAIDNSLSTHPVRQYAWNLYFDHSYKPTDIPKIWLFGNDKFLSMVAQMDSFWCSVMGFGALEVIDTSETGGYFTSDTNTGSYKWYNNQEWTFLDRTYYNHFHENRAKSNSEVMTSCGTATQGFVKYWDLIDYGKAVPWAERRPLFKPMISMEFDSDGLWRPIGQVPIFRINHKDLQMGENLVYGSKEYIAFPKNKINDINRYNGVAYRIV